MKIINFFPYRKAYVRGKSLYFPRELMENLESELAKMANVDKDNHVCYLVKFESFPVPIDKGIMFTDSHCIIGDIIDIKNW
jgi:hypothetical protein